MLKKLPLLLAGGVGYVLGTRAGRERYEKIRASAKHVASDPRVRSKVHQATDMVKEQAPVVKDKVSSAASQATAKVRSAEESDEETTPSSQGFPATPDGAV